MKLPVRSERKQIDRCFTHTRTLGGSERASANRCKKLKSMARVTQKVRQQQIQINQNTHTQIAKNDLQTYRLADGCQAETKTSTLRSHVSEGKQYSQNCKDSDHTKKMLEEIS